MTDVQTPPPGATRLESFPDGPSRGRRTILVVLLVVALLGLGVAGAGALWYQGQVDPSGEPSGEVEVVIPNGSTPQAIGEILHDEGVIGDPRAFRIWLRLHGGGGGFKAGEYTFQRNMSFGEAAELLEKGPSVEFSTLTIPEGFTLEQIAERVGTLPGRDAEVFLTLARSGEVRSSLQPAGSNNLEGLLLPETYNISEKEDERAILERLVGAFESAASALGIDQAQAKVGITPYEAVIVASLVEREARRDQDRGPVAEVVYNRLEKGMLLQIDAAILYAIGHKDRVLNRDLEVDSPYNLYKRAGLPPTPIAAPGRAALQATIDPPSHDFFYYVTINDCTGETVFGKTLADHNRNVNRRKAENC